MTQERISPFYPQSNGKIESWHRTVKRRCIRPKVPPRLEDGRRAVATLVNEYNVDPFLGPRRVSQNAQDAPLRSEKGSDTIETARWDLLNHPHR